MADADDAPFDFTEAASRRLPEVSRPAINLVLETFDALSEDERIDLLSVAFSNVFLAGVRLGIAELSGELRMRGIELSGTVNVTDADPDTLDDADDQE